MWHWARSVGSRTKPPDTAWRARPPPSRGRCRRSRSRAAARCPHRGMRTDPAFVRSRIGVAQLVTRAALDAELALVIAKLGRLSGRLFQQRQRGMARQAIGNRPLFRRADEFRIRPGDRVGGPLPLRGDVRVAVGAALRRAVLHLAFRQTATGQRQQQGESRREAAADPKGIRGRTVHDLVPDAAERLAARRHVVRRRGAGGGIRNHSFR